MLIYQCVVLGILVGLLLNTLNNLRLMRRPATQPAPDAGPLVSILIPARNEARAIARCLVSLARQDYPTCEILVLDDQSDDDTAAIVERLARRHPQIHLLHGKPLPPNWHGKAHACAQLAQAARGEWMLFVDADTIHVRSCVSTALRMAQERHADLLTMMPRLEVGGFGERLLLPTIPLTFATVLPLGLVMNTPSPLFAGALGPFLLFRRASYLRAGGHAAVRTDIVEDMQLSRLVKRAGGRVVWIDGTALMRVRLYHNLREAWRGLTKSAFAAIDYSLPGLLLGLPLCVAVMLLPYAFLVAVILSQRLSLALFWLPLAQVAVLWAAYWLPLRRFQLPRGVALLFPATTLAIIVYTLHSAYQVVLGDGVVWKGRSYAFGRRQRSGPHTRIATELALVRLLIAFLLILLGWHWGSLRLRVAAPLALAGWTLALVEHALKRVPVSQTAPHSGARAYAVRPYNASDGGVYAAGGSWLGLVADAAVGIAGAAYLELSGLLPIWLLLAALILLAVSAWLVPWRAVPAVAGVLFGGLLLLAAGSQAPGIDIVLVIWTAILIFFARRPITQTLQLWRQRVRSQ